MFFLKFEQFRNNCRKTNKSIDKQIDPKTSVSIYHQKNLQINISSRKLENITSSIIMKYELCMGNVASYPAKGLKQENRNTNKYMKNMSIKNSRKTFVIT
jgi:hypothetical protein